MLESAEQNLERIQSGVTNEVDMTVMMNVDSMFYCVYPFVGATGWMKNIL